MISLEAVSEGVVLSVKASAGSRRCGITGIHNGALRVAVTEPPEKGKANAAILIVLAESLELRKSQLELMSGQTSSLKKFLIRDCDVQQLRARILDLFGGLETSDSA